MKTPIDTVEGKIVDVSPTGEITIKARYDDINMLLKREYKKCKIQLIDGRKLSNRQRKMCYAMLKEIAEYTGMGLDSTKEYMKLKFLSEDLQETADQIFSLSDGAMSLVCAFQRFLINFILDWEIPCKVPLLEYVDDVGDYLYACLVHKKCCICGEKADLHHVTRVGMGRNRNDIIHEGMEALPLCREHHTEIHYEAYEKFERKYHIDPAHGIKLDKSLCKIYGLKADGRAEEEVFEKGIVEDNDDELLLQEWT